MIGIPIGLLAANATEWIIHKHVLHGLGKRRESIWAFHWHDHHSSTRRNGGVDESYQSFPRGWNSRTKELVAMVAGGLPVLALFPVAPFFVGTAAYAGWNYYRKHKRAHVDPEWAKAHLPWHYDHHMGPVQDANWCVTKPWFDDLMGTRKPYVGTPRFVEDEAKRDALQAPRGS